MFGKIFSESAWKGLVTKFKIKDNGLLRGLGTLSKLGEDDHGEVLKALASIQALAKTLSRNKDVSSQPEVSDHLDDLLSAATDHEKEVKTAAAAAEKEAAKAEKEKGKKEKEDARKKDEEEEEDDDEDEEEEEEQGDYSERLLSTLRRIKSMQGKPMALLICDARPLPLIAVAKRIGSKGRKELTAMSGGCAKFLKIGTCHFEEDHYVLTLEQSRPGLARKVQKSVKGFTGKRFKFSHGGESAGDDEDEGGGSEGEGEGESPEATATPPAPEAPAAEKAPAPGEPPEAATAGAGVGAAGPAAPAADESKPPEEKEMEVLQDRRRLFKSARAAWVAAKAQAEEDLEQVKNGAHEMYLTDPEQFPKIVAGCKSVDEIMDHLDDELRDTLDQYASTPLKNQAKLKELGATATEVLSRYIKYVEGNEVMKAIDQKEFADVTIHAPVLKALTDLEKTLHSQAETVIRNVK